MLFNQPFCLNTGRRAARARADQSYTQFAVMDDENVSALQQVCHLFNSLFDNLNILIV